MVGWNRSPRLFETLGYKVYFSCILACKSAQSAYYRACFVQCLSVVNLILWPREPSLKSVLLPDPLPTCAVSRKHLPAVVFFCTSSSILIRERRSACTFMQRGSSKDPELTITHSAEIPGARDKAMYVCTWRYQNQHPASSFLHVCWISLRCGKVRSVSTCTKNIIFTSVGS